MYTPATRTLAASISRLKNQFRLQIILKSASRKEIRRTLDQALKQAETYGDDLRAYTIEINLSI